MKDYAIVVVDMLYDFIDGSMACHNAEEAVKESIQAIEKLTETDFDPEESGIFGKVPILFICDHHPKNHSSFTAEGGPWPEHCVQETKGCQIHEDLQKYVNEDLTFYKGKNPAEEQYSGFEGKNLAGQNLSEILDLMDIKNVFVCGIATEFCVKNTCEDLKKAGYKVHLIEKALAYVDAEGHKQAISEMKKEGIRIF